MTGIAGVLGENESSAVSTLKLLVDAMQIRGTITRSLTVSGKNATVAIGSCSHQGEDSPNNTVESTSLVADGKIPSDLRVEEIGGQVGRSALSEAMRTGPFSCLSISEGKLLAARDVMGLKPLYMGRNDRGTVAIASLKTALWKIGISSPKPATPGLLVSLSDSGESTISDQTLSKPETTRISERSASSRLKSLLVDSLEDSFAEDSSLAFSGGLDSTLVARAAQENGMSPQLITVSMKGQAETDHAKQVAKHLGLEAITRELSKEDVIEALPRVIEIVESTDPVVVGVSLPLFFACEIAHELGCRNLLAGQLSDELFAGYGRFDALAASNRAQQAAEEVWRSVWSASENDFEPGDKLAVSHRLELQCPFASLPLVKFALRLPVSLKLRVLEGRVVRKYILRQLATDWQLPRTVSERPKKAAQYSSGVQKVLLKEAKKRHQTLRAFLNSHR